MSEEGEYKPTTKKALESTPERPEDKIVPEKEVEKQEKAAAAAENK